MSDLLRLKIRHDQEWERIEPKFIATHDDVATAYELGVKHGRELERAEREQVEQDEPRTPEYEVKPEVPE